MSGDFLIPDPFVSAEQFNRFYHSDIPRLEDTDLTDELNALRPELWGLPVDHWFRERVKMLEAEKSKRQSGGTEIFRWSESKQAEGIEV
jgi:hypothetical protein